MSRDARPRAGRRALVPAVILAAVIGTGAVLAACGGDPPSSGPVAPDETTARIAAVEAARQCVIVGRAFPAEDDITADLESRLDDAGLTYAQWKHWHDALATSPELVEQYAAAERADCPGA